MAAHSAYIQELILNPRESLSVELKAWLDLGNTEHAAKIIKTCIALRNHGGGFLLVGLDDPAYPRQPSLTQ